jgi:hypothetical protein
VSGCTVLKSTAEQRVGSQQAQACMIAASVARLIRQILHHFRDSFTSFPGYVHARSHVVHASFHRFFLAKALEV